MYLPNVYQQLLFLSILLRVLILVYIDTQIISTCNEALPVDNSKHVGVLLIIG